MAAHGPVRHQPGEMLQAGARIRAVQRFEPAVHADQQLQGPTVPFGNRRTGRVPGLPIDHRKGPVD